MLRFTDFLFAVPAVMLTAAVLKVGGGGLLAVVALPLWGMYLLGRTHGMRALREAQEKARPKDRA